jgi:hypothetical protein
MVQYRRFVGGGKKGADKRMRAKRRLGTTRAILLLAAVFLPAANISQAKYSGGTGEPNNPYRMATPNDLNDIGNHPNDWDESFVLVNDINMAGYTCTTALIAPDISSNIDFQGTPFTGIFDGNDCNIGNLSIDTGGGDSDWLGLFGQIGESGQVKNLGIEDCNISGRSCWYLGGLAGENHSGEVSNCYATGSVSGKLFVGGLVALLLDMLMSVAWWE